MLRLIKNFAQFFPDLMFGRNVNLSKKFVSEVSISKMIRWPEVKASIVVGWIVTGMLVGNDEGCLEGSGVAIEYFGRLERKLKLALRFEKAKIQSKVFAA